MIGAEPEHRWDIRRVTGAGGQALIDIFGQEHVVKVTVPRGMNHISGSEINKRPDAGVTHARIGAADPTIVHSSEVKCVIWVRGAQNESVIGGYVRILV